MTLTHLLAPPYARHEDDHRAQDAECQSDGQGDDEVQLALALSEAVAARDQRLVLPKSAVLVLVVVL